MMKIITYILGALLIAALAAAAVFYFMTFKPMSEDYARMKQGMPELVKAKTELKKYKEKESEQTKEAAWVKPVIEAINAGLADEIKAGKAEVGTFGNSVVINIAENALYTPESKTFANDTQPRLKLTALLKKDELKGKDILVGNVTETVAARGKGKKRILPKDALTLASERSEELVKSLGKESVAAESIAAVAYSTKVPDRGFKIKNRKTMIMIGSYPPAATPAPVKQEAVPAKPVAPAKPAAPSAAPAPGQPKTIPIKPAQPKTP